FPVQQSVSGSLKGEIRRQFEKLKTALIKPFPEVFLLALPFRMKKTAQNEFSANGKPGISREDHVRQTTMRGDFFNLGVLFQKPVECLPLLSSCLPRRLMDIPLHPGINDIINVVLVWRTH